MLKKFSEAGLDIYGRQTRTILVKMNSNPGNQGPAHRVEEARRLFRIILQKLKWRRHGFLPGVARQLLWG
jgi:hypothetical protein